MVLKRWVRHRWVTREWSKRTLIVSQAPQNTFSWLKNSEEINQFLAVSGINLRFKSQFMVFSTCENVGGNLESLRGRLHRNGRIRPIGRLGVTFQIGRLGVNEDKQKLFSFSILTLWFMYSIKKSTLSIQVNISPCLLMKQQNKLQTMRNIHST